MLVTIDSNEAPVLSRKTEDFKLEEFPVEVEIAAEALLQEIQPYLPCAGLAAPQININRSIFLYTYDRDPENLTFAINPTYVPLGDERQASWEGCLSVIHSKNCFELASIPRYKKIKASYLNRTGQIEEVILEGFGAKVFQHECDHLQGIINIKHPLAEVKAFASQEELLQFSKAMREKDATTYQNPSV